MSSSSGTSITPEELLKVCPPEMIMWLYAKVPARQSWSFCFDDEILRQYHEFDRSLLASTKENCPQNIKEVFDAIGFGRTITPNPVSAQLLFSLGSIVNFEPNMTYSLYKKVDNSITKEQLLERLTRIKYWAETYSPESITKLLEHKNEEYFASLSDKEKEDIKKLYRTLAENDYSLEDLQQVLYDIPKVEGLTDKENKPHQQTFFQNVYMLLTGKASGPRLYLFLGALNKDMYLNLLNY